jgi:hypothetical protein
VGLFDQQATADRLLARDSRLLLAFPMTASLISTIPAPSSLSSWSEDYPCRRCHHASSGTSSLGRAGTFRCKRCDALTDYATSSQWHPYCTEDCKDKAQAGESADLGMPSSLGPLEECFTEDIGSREVGLDATSSEDGCGLVQPRWRRSQYSECLHDFE